MQFILVYLPSLSSTLPTATQFSPSKLGHTCNLHDIALVLRLLLHRFLTTPLPAPPSSKLPPPILSCHTHTSFYLLSAWYTILHTDQRSRYPTHLYQQAAPAATYPHIHHCSPLCLMVPLVPVSIPRRGHIHQQVLRKHQSLAACHAVCDQTTARPRSTCTRSATQRII
jgi:hypothetical protein